MRSLRGFLDRKVWQIKWLKEVEDLVLKEEEEVWLVALVMEEVVVGVNNNKTLMDHHLDIPIIEDLHHKEEADPHQDIQTIEDLHHKVEADPHQAILTIEDQVDLEDQVKAEEAQDLDQEEEVGTLLVDNEKLLNHKSWHWESNKKLR